MEFLLFAKSRRGGELIGIVILAAGISLGAALISYHPDDSSAFYTSTNNAISNVIGYYGATVAWLFVGFLGFASLLFPIGMLVVGWQRFWGREVEYVQTKALGWVTLLIAAPPLLDLTFSKVWIRGALIAAGGYLGQEIDRAATANLNRGGSAILFGTMLLVGILLSTRISLAAIFAAVQENLIGFGRGVTLQWARLTERRRKEKMKVAIVKKHALRLVEQDQPMEEDSGPLVREVKGPGRFQIRKVTKADLRAAAEALANQEQPDPFALYADESGGQRPSAVRTAEGGGPPQTVLIPRPAVKPVKTARRDLRLGNDQLPPVSLLASGAKQDQIDDEVHKKYLEIGRLIEARCREFAVEGEVTAYHPGPVVTTFEFKPSAGVKYARVVNLGDDLALALKAESIRIERISGSSTVGIEVPNRKRDLITLRDIVDTEIFVQSQSMLTLALGKDIHGEPIVTDMSRMPHLLVAGATGAGKSVGLNSMIVSLLYKALPRQLRMLMIDPKMVELKIYEDIPHLLHPIVTDPKLASNALMWAVAEMENRYRTLAECGVRNIDQYNALLKDPEAHRRARKAAPDDTTPTPEPMHFIVIIIDEFADLMMVAPKDVEDSVTRLAQKARAVGIHLIVATQRPSVDVITGVIKANFPSRIAYQVASKVDSRTILDTQGAEKLLGSGDMLFLPPGTARIRRIHGAYVSEPEINEVVDFVKKNQGEPKFLEEITKIPEEKSAVDGIQYLDDPKYDEAVRVVLSTGQASASYLQRRLKLGYSRAARLIEIMEAHGIVGPSQGSKPRDILIRAEDYPTASGEI